MFAIINARIIDGTKKPPVENGTILVENGVISKVGTGVPLPEGISVLNAAGKTVIPGLLDAHTHFGGTSGFERPGFGLPVETVDYAEAREGFLRWGVTTVRTCGDVSPEILDFRDAVNEGTFAYPSPTVVAVGPWFQKMNGHPAFTVGLAAGMAEPDRREKSCILIDEATDIEAEVKRVAQMNVDAIKVFLGHINKTNYPTPVPKLSREELRRVVTAAHENGKTVLCHVDEPSELLEASLCGVDCVEHLMAVGAQETVLTDEMVEVLLKNHTKVDPTMICMKAWDNGQLKGAEPVYEKLKTAVKKLYDAGVPLYAGCDSGIPFVPFGESLHDEMSCLCEAGIPAAKVLQMATLGNAQLFGLAKKTGSIEAGKAADLVALNADPLENIENTKKIAWVIKDGKIVRS